jgi:hypothetical protein
MGKLVNSSVYHDLEVWITGKHHGRAGRMKAGEGGRTADAGLPAVLPMLEAGEPLVEIGDAW